MKMKTILFFILAAGISVTVMLLRGPDIPEDFPEHAYGTWETDHPRYEERFFELSAHTVTFGVGDGQSVAYALSGIKKHMERGKPFYILIFEDKAKNRFEKSIWISPKMDTLVFKNQGNVKWYKTENW